MKRLVVGTDTSGDAANAMRWASRLASSHGADIVLMTAFQPTDPHEPPSRIEALTAQHHDFLDGWGGATNVGNVRVSTVVVHGDPRPGILEVAARHDADLIVVGRAGASSGPGLFHLGSMAEYLAHHSDRPLAVIGGAVNLAVRSILVGVDGSEHSHAAIQWIADMTSGSETEIIAATVDQPYIEWVPSTSPKSWRRDAEQRIRSEWASELTAAGLDFTPLVLRGSNVADVLLEVARDERTDLVAVGMRGLGGFSGLRIGGVALKVLHRADRPVILIPPSQATTGPITE